MIVRLLSDETEVINRDRLIAPWAITTHFTIRTTRKLEVLLWHTHFASIICL
jgi:hypothetical protein